MVIAGLEWLYRLHMISNPTPCVECHNKGI